MRQFEKFKNRKTAFFSLIILVFLIAVSLAAEFIANDKPIFVFHNSKISFPLFKDYPASEFNAAGIKPEYREICQLKDNFCLFPFVRYSPVEIVLGVDQYPSPPSWEHPMGLDSVGRDIFARMIYGFRVSLGYAIGVWVLAFSIGILIGASMGYFGGWYDTLMYRFKEIFFAIPYLIVLITLTSIFNPNIVVLVIISSLFAWGSIARYMRAEFLKIRKLDYVTSARAAGASTRQIIFKHILPNALTPIITFSPFFIASSILSLSSLDFLGLGVPPPTPSWGELLKQGKDHFMGAWYLAVFPATGLFVTLALINFVGEGIRDAFDPRRY